MQNFYGVVDKSYFPTDGAGNGQANFSLSFLLIYFSIWCAVVLKLFFAANERRYQTKTLWTIKLLCM